MERETRHVEWGRLRIAGRPLITGIAVGETPLLWIACRASPRLVHVYCDSQFKVLWHFHSDPIFLHLEKARGRRAQKGCMAAPCEVNFDEKASSPSLLVVASDGSVWFLPVCSADAAAERPSKRKKECHGVKTHKIVPSFSASEAQKIQRNTMPKSQCRKDEWGLFEDINLYENMECDDDLAVLCEKDQLSDSLVEENLKASMHGNCGKQLRTSAGSEVLLQIKKLTISSPQNVFRKTIANLVMRENLIGIVNGARFAAFGPQDTVIVISTFGLELFQASYSAANSSTFFNRVESMGGEVCFCRDPTCALIVSAENVPSDGYGQAGDKITLSIPGGQIISIFIKGSQVQEGRCLIQLHFEAPSLRLGCLLREALIWRLKTCEAIGSFQNGKNSLPVHDLEDRSTVDAQGLEIKQQTVTILHRAEAVSKVWNEIRLQDTGVTKEFLPVLGDVRSIVNDLLKVYKSLREI